MRSYKEFKESLTKEQKRKSQEMYDKAMKGLEGPPILCGPEGRAQANGTLKEYYKKCAKYVKKINLKYWD